RQTARAIEDKLSRRARQDVIRTALEGDASGLFVAEDMERAVTFVNRYAAEHLSIQTRDARNVLDRVSNAGSVFMGNHTPVAAGDYAIGPNHILPTDGWARSTGGVSVDTFVRGTTVQRLDRDALEDMRETIDTLARQEGLEAHAASVEARFSDFET
ncbi:MAG: histidinol dehydrogenase, partial [Halobacteriaceae archaeon]